MHILYKQLALDLLRSLISNKNKPGLLARPKPLKNIAVRPPYAGDADVALYSSAMKACEMDTERRGRSRTIDGEKRRSG